MIRNIQPSIINTKFIIREIETYSMCKLHNIPSEDEETKTNIYLIWGEAWQDYVQ